MSNLERDLDICRSEIFRHPMSAFYGSLLCNVAITWNKNIPTAQTNGVHIQWNPDWFQSLPPKSRVTVLFHELKHIGHMHILRLGDKDPDLWNKATDCRINNDLHKEGYSFESLENAWMDPSYDKNADDGILASEEEIYLKMKSKSPNLGKNGTWGVVGDTGGDLKQEEGAELTSEMKQQLLNAVTYAVQSAKAMSGNIPGNLETTLNKLLKPKIKWELELRRYLTDLAQQDYTWKRPNLKYTDVYLPSLQDEDERLESLAYILDTSGSCSDDDLNRFLAEVRYIWSVLKPKKLTIVQFDTRIQKVDVYTEGMSLNSINIVGRGGTDLSPVHKWITDNKPTCTVIFSDMECSPMQPTKHPVIWVKYGNGGHVPSGRVITMEVDN